MRMSYFNNDELLNLLDLTKRVLEFYADSNNYHENGTIYLDKGEHARTTLNIVDNVIKTHENIDEVMDEELKKILNIFDDEDKNIG